MLNLLNLSVPIVAKTHYLEIRRVPDEDTISYQKDGIPGNFGAS